MCTLGNTHDCCLNCTDGGTKEYTEQQSLAHSSSWKNQVFFYLDLGTSCSTSISIDHSEPGACPWLVFWPCCPLGNLFTLFLAQKCFHLAFVILVSYCPPDRREHESVMACLPISPYREKATTVECLRDTGVLLPSTYLFHLGKQSFCGFPIFYGGLSLIGPILCTFFFLSITPVCHRFLVSTLFTVDHRIFQDSKSQPNSILGRLSKPLARVFNPVLWENGFSCQNIAFFSF